MKGGEFRRLWLARLGLETATAGSGELDVKHSIDVGRHRFAGFIPADCHPDRAS